MHHCSTDLTSIKNWLLLVCWFVLGNTARADIFDQSLGEIAQLNPARYDDLTLETPDTGLAAWIDNPQARIKIDNIGAGSGSSSYRMRFRPIFKKEQRVHNTISGFQLDRQTLGREQQVLQRLSSVYQRTVDIVQGELNKQNLSKQVDQLNLSAQYHRSLAQTKEFDPARLQKVKFDIARVNKAQEVIVFRNEQLMLAMASQEENAAERIDSVLNMKAILMPNEIWELVQRYKTDWFNKIMSRQAAGEALTAKMAHEVLTLSQAQSGFGLNLLEMELNDDASDNSYGMTFGFRLPNLGSNREVIRRRLDLAEANDRYYNKEYASHQKVSELFDELELNFKEWSAYDELLSKYSDDEVGSKSTNPELILARAEEQLSLSRRTSTSYINMLRTYVELISISGVIAERPLRNWLKTGHPVIAGL